MRCDGDGVSGECTWCGESVAGEVCEGEDGGVHCCGYGNIGLRFICSGRRYLGKTVLFGLDWKKVTGDCGQRTTKKLYRKESSAGK